MLVTALALSLAAAAVEPPPWLGPAFSADPAAMARAAAALEAPKDAEVDLLLLDNHLSYDEAGRETRVWRMVFVPRTRGAVEGWGTISAEYNPRFEGRPEIRARVISPAGKATELDPASVVDGGVDRSDKRQYGDWRQVHAVLPALEPGAVVEEELVLRETAPFFAAGVATRIFANRPQPVRALRVRVEAPAALPLRVASHGLPAVKEATAGGKRTFTLAVNDLAGLAEQEVGTPPERIRPRHIDISTSASWAEIAKGYAALVEKQLEGSDLAAIAKEIVKPGDAPAEAAQKVVEWIGARVRYTGLTLHQTGLVPATPAETMQRRFGDCKDLSTLAVGLLRAAGLRADVALLNTSNEQPEPGHPGMGPFDHAVVRIEARPPVWLDPANEMPAGALGPESQGRLALIAAPGSTGLVRTPESGPEASRVTRLRRIELAEAGMGKALEENRYAGVLGALATRGLRAETAEEGERFARQRLRAPNGAVKRQFDAGAGKTPSLWRAEAAQSQLGMTGPVDARALASPAPMFTYLQQPFRTEPLDPGAVDAPPPPRKEPLRIAVPYETELRYEIVPPPGFRAAPLPSVENFTVGSTRFEARFLVQPDGVVVARYTLTVGRDLEPAQADLLWRKVADLTGGDGPWVTFERTSTALEREGKPREALDEIRRLIQLHPAEARHHNHLALLLLDLHMGEAARAEARRAVALEPDSEWSQRVLANTLRRDLLGRLNAPGADLPAAEAALRKAVELSSGGAGARGMLADLLLLDGRGTRVGPGPRLDEALELLRQVRAGGDRSFDDSWLEALLAAGRAAEALDEAKRASPSPRRNAVLVAAGLLQGEGAFKDAMGRLDPSALAAAMKSGVVLLFSCRRYEGLGTLAATARSRGATGPELELLERIARTRSAPEKLDPRDPALLPERLFRTLTDPDPATAAAPLLRGGRPPSTAEIEFVRGIDFTKLAGGEGIGLSTILDLLHSIAKVEVEGDGPWRIDVSVPTDDKGRRLLRVIAVREKKLPKVALVDPGPGALARLALELGRAGDLAAARRLVGWARQGLESAAPASPSPGGVAAALWPASGEPSNAELLRFAAGLAAFAPDEPHLELGLARLREGASGPARTALAFAELVASDGDPARVLALADELSSTSPEMEAAVTSRRVLALHRSGRKGEARRLAEERLTAHPDELYLLRLLIEFTYADGEVETARRHEARLLAHAAARPADANNAAWRRLFFPPLEAKTLEQARAAGERAKGADQYLLHTLACLEAFLERPPTDAMASLLKAIEARRGFVIDEDWVVVGRVAEMYGLAEAAIAAYQRVPKPAEHRFDSTYVLAQRRLAGLEAARKPRADGK